MTTRRKLFLFIFLIIVALNVIFIGLRIKGKEKREMIITVEGFEVEYNSTSEKVMEDFDGIELGSSMADISNQLGEPDTWIGSGMLRPVYFLKDYKIIVLHFKYPAVCEDLEQIILIGENGESKIIKEGVSP